MAVCEQTFSLYARETWRDPLALVPPRVPLADDERRSFPCGTDGARGAC